MVWSFWKKKKKANPKDVKTNSNSYNKRNMKIRRPRKSWRDNVEEGLNTVGIKDRQAMARVRRECRKIVSETMVHCGLLHLR